MSKRIWCFMDGRWRGKNPPVIMGLRELSPTRGYGLFG